MRGDIPRAGCDLVARRGQVSMAFRVVASPTARRLAKDRGYCTITTQHRNPCTQCVLMTLQ